AETRTLAPWNMVRERRNEPEDAIQVEGTISPARLGGAARPIAEAAVESDGAERGGGLPDRCGETGASELGVPQASGGAVSFERRSGGPVGELVQAGPGEGRPGAKASAAIPGSDGEVAGAGEIGATEPGMDDRLQRLVADAGS